MATFTDFYIDGLILRDGVPLMWQFGGGYVTLNTNGAPTSWNYYVEDHLGSTRIVVASNNSVKETINYYPYGSEMTMTVPSQLTTNPDWQPYRFTGKELIRQNGLNMYDFGARLFDVAGLPIWTSMDPIAEKYYHLNPYLYCAGDPVNLFDPDGDRILVHVFDSNNFVWNYYYYDMELRAFVDSDGNKYNGENGEFESIRNAIIEICTTNEGKRLISYLANNVQNVLIKAADNFDNKEGQGLEEFNCYSSVHWNPNNESKFGGGSFITLTHELAHSEDRIRGTVDERIWTSLPDENRVMQDIKQAEKYSTHIENMVRKEKGLNLRPSYGYPSGAPILNRKK